MDKGTNGLKEQGKYANWGIKQIQNKMKYYFLLTKLDGFERCYSTTFPKEKFGNKTKQNLIPQK